MTTGRINQVSESTRLRTHCGLQACAGEVKRTFTMGIAQEQNVKRTTLGRDLAWTQELAPIGA